MRRVDDGNADADWSSDEHQQDAVEWVAACMYEEAWPCPFLAVFRAFVVNKDCATGIVNRLALPPDLPVGASVQSLLDDKLLSRGCACASCRRRRHRHHQAADVV